MTNNNTKNYKVYNSTIIEALSKQYNVDKSFIYRALKSERSSEKAILIKKDYKEIYFLISPIVSQHQTEIEKIIEDFITVENAKS